MMSLYTIVRFFFGAVGVLSIVTLVHVIVNIHLHRRNKKEERGSVRQSTPSDATEPFTLFITSDSAVDDSMMGPGNLPIALKFETGLLDTYIPSSNEPPRLSAASLMEGAIPLPVSEGTVRCGVDSPPVRATEGDRAAFRDGETVPRVIVASFRPGFNGPPPAYTLPARSSIDQRAMGWFRRHTPFPWSGNSVQ